VSGASSPSRSSACSNVGGPTQLATDRAAVKHNLWRLTRDSRLLARATPWPFVIHDVRTNRTLAQIELFANNKDGKYQKKVYVLPKSLDEKVARLHLAKIGVKLTGLRKDQADYIGVKPEGPFKSDHYRY
jgi:hypothetical protein